MDLEVPKEALPELKCNKCGCILSNFPIYSDPSNGHKYCNKCCPNESNCIVECAYGFVAKQLLFPCKNHIYGCKEMINGKICESHENYCKYIPVRCQCKWTGLSSEIGYHLQKDHGQTFNINKKIMESPGKITPIDQTSLDAITCFICKQYMIPPIYQHWFDTNICASCKKINTSHKAKLRNYSLEAITEVTSYPCRYKCGSILNCKSIRMHEKFCDKFSCPKDGCILKVTNMTLSEHLIKQHPKLLISKADVVFYYTEARVDDFIFAQRHDGIFKIFSQFRNQHFRWSVQYIGHPDEAKKYFYSLHINGSDGSIMMEQICAAWTDEVFGEKMHFVELPYCVLCPFIKNKSISYCINIFNKYSRG